MDRHHCHRHRQSGSGSLPPPWGGGGQRAGLLYLQRGPDDFQPAAGHLSVRRAVQPRREAGLLAAGRAGGDRPSAPDGAVRQDLRRLRLRQHRAAVSPHCQSLWHGGAGLHPDRPAGIFRRRGGVRGLRHPAEKVRHPQPALPGYPKDPGPCGRRGAGKDEARGHPAEHGPGRAGG